MEKITKMIQELKKATSREAFKKNNRRYGPLLIPKDRTMTKAQYKLMDHITRKTYRENEEKIRAAQMHMLMYGTVFMDDRMNIIPMEA